MLGRYALLRRFDVNRSGRIESDDVQAVYAARRAGLVTRAEVRAVVRAWFVGEKFSARVVAVHPRDSFPSLRTVAARFLRARGVVSPWWSRGVGPGG